MDKIIHKTWLLKGLFHSAPGIIEIENNSIKFSLVERGTFSKEGLNSFLNDSSFSLKLEENKPVKVFEFNLDDVRFHSPWYMMKGGGTIKVSGKEYKLSFMQPQNTKFPYHKLGMIKEDDFKDFKDGREFGKKLISLINY